MLPWLFYDFDKAEHFAGAVLFLAVLGRQVKGVLCSEKLYDSEIVSSHRFPKESD